MQDVRLLGITYSWEMGPGIRIRHRINSKLRYFTRQNTIWLYYDHVRLDISGSTAGYPVLEAIFEDPSLICRSGCGIKSSLECQHCVRLFLSRIVSQENLSFDHWRASIFALLKTGLQTRVWDSKPARLVTTRYFLHTSHQTWPGRLIMVLFSCPSRQIWMLHHVDNLETQNTNRTNFRSQYWFRFDLRVSRRSKHVGRDWWFCGSLFHHDTT